eukprot:CAMPEP_0181382036 /NCGR_PEP_ID=MMETSP1106-20121128/20488_1 /TAXON_ID=81844 /ORGANISM="Mantoniella antarctica, Strain SL-175" /LENGTH=183 /DNA_ID=CAMNT_0023501355 /DNA_START=196 /DNA_END=743 /DNA_ORIENTATION=-
MDSVDGDGGSESSNDADIDANCSCESVLRSDADGVYMAAALENEAKAKNSMWDMMKTNRDLLALQAVQSTLRETKEARASAGNVTVAPATAAAAAGRAAGQDACAREGEQPEQGREEDLPSEPRHGAGLLDLPEEVLTLIVALLDSGAMCALTQTCAALREVERQIGFRAICWPAICAREWDV